jgi:transposase
MKSFRLSGTERLALMAASKEHNDVRVVSRARALLWLDLGDDVDEIAERSGVVRQTVYYWVATFRARAGSDIISRLSDAPRSGRPRTALGIIDPLIDVVIDTDPQQLGYRATTWTAPLLVCYLADVHALAVSEPSVKLALRRLGIRWKRPRHQLALRPATWRQSKGG